MSTAVAFFEEVAVTRATLGIAAHTPGGVKHDQRRHGRKRSLASPSLAKLSAGLRAVASDIEALPSGDWRSDRQARVVATEALDKITTGEFGARPDVAVEVDELKATMPYRRRRDLIDRFRDLADLIDHGPRQRKPEIAPPEPETAAPASPRGRTRFAVSATDAVSPSGLTDRETIAALEDGFTGIFGDLYTGDVSVASEPNLTVISGSIRSESGNKVGDFSRELFISREGNVEARHGMLKLDANVQGQGFAQDFNDRLFEWYRTSGVEAVRLHADIDVGGYAWARAGYDWSNHRAARKVRDRATEVFQAVTAGADVRGDAAAGEHPPKIHLIDEDRRREQLAAAEQLLERFDETFFGADDYPTPYEVSQLGRWPGAGRDDWWIGKVIMVGSDWHGVITP